MVESTKFKLCGFEIYKSELTTLYNIIHYIFEKLDIDILISQINRKLNRIYEFVEKYNEKGGNIIIEEKFRLNFKEFIKMLDLLLKHFGDFKIRILYSGYLHLNFFEDMHINRENIYDDIYYFVSSNKYKIMYLDDLLITLKNNDSFCEEYGEIFGFRHIKSEEENIQILIIETIKKYLKDFKFNPLYESVITLALGDNIALRALNSVKENDIEEQENIFKMLKVLQEIKRTFVREYVIENSYTDEIFKNYPTSYLGQKLKQNSIHI